MIDAVPENAVGPSVEKLKDIFGVQKVPLASNFSDLIDIADVGRKAAGLSPAQDGIPGIGLQLDHLEKLAVRPKAESGVRVDGSGVGVIPDVSKGIKVDASGVGVVADSSRGIKVDVNGIGVDFGASLKVANGKLEVADSFAAPATVLPNGVDFDAIVPPTYRIGVYAVANESTYPNRPAAANNLAGNAFLMMFSHGNGNSNDCTQIYFNAVGGMWLRAKHDGAKVFSTWGRVNAVVADPAKGITVSDNVVGVNYGTSLTVTGGKLEVASNAGIPRGLIVMFSGAEIPDGWRLCDGGGGTPNLVDRFVLGGTLSDVNGTNGPDVSLEGDKNDKSYSMTSNSSSHTHSAKVTVSGHALDENQIPSHSHVASPALRDVTNNDAAFPFGWSTEGTAGSYWPGSFRAGSGSWLARTKRAGGGQAHSHGASAAISGGEHSHLIIMKTPYYILAFIMKL